MKIDMGGEELIMVSPDLFHVAGDSRLSDTIASRPDDCDTVFVDYAPDVFMPLVNWLRHFRDSQRDQVVEVVVPRLHRPTWIRMMMIFSFEARYLRFAGIEASELLDRGYSYESLLAAGFQDTELPVVIAERQRACNIPQPSTSEALLGEVVHCITDPCEPGSGQLLLIDIGGQKTITASRGLFSIAGENTLSQMISRMEPDKGLFVDYSPEVFMPLVDWLRRYRDSQRDRVVQVVVDRHYRTAWIRMMLCLSFELRYLRLADVSAMELTDRGCSYDDLLAAGFPDREVPDDMESVVEGGEEEVPQMPSPSSGSHGMETQRAMACIPGVPDSGPERLMRINVGGQKIVTVFPPLFGWAGENKLSVIASGRWDPPTDPDGNFFVDYSPDVFIPLVHWLRHFRDGWPDEVIEVVVDQRFRTAWIRMMLALSFELCYLRMAGIQPIELIDLGFSEESLLDARYKKGEGRWGFIQDLASLASRFMQLVTGSDSDANRPQNPENS